MDIQSEQVLEPHSFGADILDSQGFTVQDILLAVGVWTVILGLTPVIAFYMLMVH